MDAASVELVSTTACEQRSRLERGEISARELLAAHIERIEQVNPTLNAIVALDLDVALETATRIDDAVARREPVGPLAGLVTAHKDLTETADFVTTYGTPSMAGHRPTEDSMLVSRLKAAGVVAVGKTNVPEFGAGSHTHNPVYGVTRNPFDPDRSAGGSSGGAGVALATSMVSIADGSDAGGSLRNPAGWNSVVGFRPSSRRVPMPEQVNGFLPYGIEGPMGRTVDDLILLLSALTAADHRDPLHRPLDLVSRPIAPSDRPMRVAWSPDLGGLPVEADVRAVLADVPRWVSDLGWEVVEAEPDFGGADECFETIRSWSMANGPIGTLVAERAEIKPVLVDEVRRGHELGNAQIWQAMAHLTTLWHRGIAFFESFDLLLGPVSQVSPFPVEVEYPTVVDGAAMERYITWMRSCSRITAFGLPALSLPAGFTDAGLPVGVQVIGAPRADRQVLQAARSLEAANPQAGRAPGILEIRPT